MRACNVANQALRGRTRVVLLENELNTPCIGINIRLDVVELRSQKIEGPLQGGARWGKVVARGEFKDASTASRYLCRKEILPFAQEILEFEGQDGSDEKKSERDDGVEVGPAHLVPR